jgi:hypothetical protein
MAKKNYAAALATKTIIKDQSLLRHGDIKTRVRRIPELEALIPPLQPDEFRQLEANLLKEGCRDALLVWETTEAELIPGGSDETVYALVDGYNRHRICTDHCLDYKIHLRPFENLLQVRQFMIDNQLGRRNLTPEQVSYLRGLRYLAEKGERGKYGRGGQKGQFVPFAAASPNGADEEHKGQNVPYEEDPGGPTAERLAAQYKVNPKTIKRDAEFAAGLNRLASELRTEILSGGQPVNKADLQRLGKQPGPPLTTWPEVAKALQPARPQSARDGEAATVQALMTRLDGLVRRLKQPKANRKALCDEIVECAQQLGGFDNP